MRRRLDVIVPIYRNAHLAKRCVDSLLANLGEVEKLAPRIILIDDSPDDALVEELVADRLAKHAGTIVAIRNEANLGFVRSVNRGLAISLRDGRDVLLVNADTETFPGTLGNIVEVMDSDPQIGFVSPRSNNAALCSLPHPDESSSQSSTAAYDRWNSVVKTMPKSHFTPTAVGFYLMIRYDVIANFGLLDEAFGVGYEEENDLIMRANKVGIRAAIANHAFAYHAGSASFALVDLDLDQHRQGNLQRMAATHTEFLPMVRRYEASPHFRAERLLSGLLPTPSGKTRIAVDLSQLRLHTDGTSEFAVSAIKALTNVADDCFEIAAVADAEVLAFHGLDKMSGIRLAEYTSPGTFGVALRLAQPFKLNHLKRMANLAPINLYAMQDTIAEDCGYLSTTFDLAKSWGHVAKHANGLIFISKFSEHTFCNRYPWAARAKILTRLLPTKLTAYGSHVDKPSPEYVLILGNKFLHKDVDRAARRLAVALPDVKFVVLGNRDEEAGNVRMIESGGLSDAQMQGLYAGAQAVVLPSHAEGFGLGLVRALAAGRPVVARGIAATQEILESFASVRGVVVFETDVELVAAVTSAMSIDKSAVDDGHCLDWNGWADELCRFIRARLEDSDLFERARERLEAIECFEHSTQECRDGEGLPVTNSEKERDLRHSLEDLAAALRKTEGAQFIEQAYRVILGRRADRAGKEHYTAQLSAGVCKEEIVMQIASSDEAKARGVCAQDVMAAAGMTYVEDRGGSDAKFSLASMLARIWTREPHMHKRFD